MYLYFRPHAVNVQTQMAKTTLSIFNSGKNGPDLLPDAIRIRVAPVLPCWVWTGWKNLPMAKLANHIRIFYYPIAVLPVLVTEIQLWASRMALAFAYMV